VDKEFMPNNLTERRYYYQFQNFIKSDKDFNGYIKSLDRKQLSKFKNSLLLLRDNDFEIRNLDDYLSECKRQRKKAKKYKTNKEDQLKVKALEMKINKIKSMRNKVAFRLQEISGLRVAELEKLKAENILLSADGKLRVQVINGKYGNNRIVDCFKDDWVVNQLLKLKPKNNGNLFNTKETLMKEAKKNKFHSHDLRKIYAHSFFYNCLESKEETLNLLAENMGHKDIKETYVYLNRALTTRKSKIEKVKPFEKKDLI
jgi:integrase